MKIRGVDFAMYSVSDLKKSVAFYRDILGLKVASEGEGWAELLAGDFAIVLGSWGFDASKVGGGSCVGLAFADDLEDLKKELTKKGIENEVWDTPVCTGLTIKDLDGNKLSLHKRKDGTFG